MDAVGYVASGNIFFPENDGHPISKTMLSELDAFSADMSAPHDDLVDMLTSAVKIAYEQKGLF